jgi:hypothetical protein
VVFGVSLVETESRHDRQFGAMFLRRETKKATRQFVARGFM